MKDWFSTYMRLLDDGYSEASAARLANEYGDNWKYDEQEDE